MKRCIIKIKNMDELCFPRAFVMTKAYVDKDPHYKELAQGRKFQEFLAKQLHQEAGVPEGPCGRAETQQFQAHVGSEGIQIIVLEGQQGTIWYKDHTYDDAHKKICLLKVQNHFHGLRSIPALLNRSYYCHHCEKGYDHETSEKHNCRGQNCSSCRRTNGTCPKFATYGTAEVYCDQCHESFTDRTVMTRTSEERKVFATNLESVAKLTSSTPKRNITAITLFAQTVKK